MERASNRKWNVRPEAPPTRCGVCGAPIVVIEGAGAIAVLEVSEGEKVPHRCPAVAVARWVILRKAARIARLGLMELARPLDVGHGEECGCPDCFDERQDRRAW